MLQLGRTPSHFSFLLRQIIHASLFGLGTFALSGASRPLASTVGLREPFCDCAFVSIRSFCGGEAVLGDMLAGERCHHEATTDSTLRSGWWDYRTRRDTSLLLSGGAGVRVTASLARTMRVRRVSCNASVGSRPRAREIARTPVGWRW